MAKLGVCDKDQMPHTYMSPGRTIQGCENWRELTDELEPVIEHQVVLCGDPLYHCRCTKPHGHVEADDKVHACGDDVCGGSWYWIDETRFVPVTMPKGVYNGAAMPPPPDVYERDGVPFVQCTEDGNPYVPPPLSFLRGPIKFFPPPKEIDAGQ